MDVVLVVEETWEVETVDVVLLVVVELVRVWLEVKEVEELELVEEGFRNMICAKAEARRSATIMTTTSRMLVRR